MSSISALDSLLSSSNSAIDLSAILQAATGGSTPGIDVNAAVTSAVNAAEAPEQAWAAQQTTLQNQTTALQTIQSDATNLDNDAQTINSLTGPFSAATVSSSNSGILTGSAAPGSAAGNNIVVVTNLATTASYSSTAVASSVAALPAETITITPATGSAKTFTTGSGVNTLGDLETTINAAGLGVTASIVTDATGSRLAITANNSGSAASFAVSSTGGTFGFTPAGTGNNASLTVNGITISSASNTVTGAIPGVTLSLLGASPGTQVSLNVAPDTSQASNAVSQFVSDYNTLIGALNTQFADSGSGQGVLADDPTVQTLQSELLGSLDYTATTGSGTNLTVTSLASLGISVNDDGTLGVNSTTLNNALQNNFSTVQNFFQGSALNGFANSMDQQLTSFLSPADGAFTVDLQSISTENTALQDNINDFQTNIIGPLQTQLQAQFSAAEIALQQLPDEIKNIDAELGLNTSSSS
jgi:flagellar hook-associated protein 2